jgi:cytochrome c
MALAGLLAGGSALAVPAPAAPDVANGRAIFQHTCANCHSVDIGVNKVGPSLWQIVGRPSATIQDYPYSEAMKNLHLVWTPDALRIYLADPRGAIHGVKMFFKGLSTASDREDVIAYLSTL